MEARTASPLTVAIIAGGPSREAEVSRRSAQGVYAALLQAGAQARVLELDQRLAHVLSNEAFDAVFPVTHGPLGEDGCLQGLLEVLGLPYVGSGVRASAVAAHKPTAKSLFRASGLPVPEEVLVVAGQEVKDAVEQAMRQLGAALVIKPASGGSAIGVVRLPEADRESLSAAVDSVLALDDALIERLHQGAEVTCGVIEQQGKARALPPTLIEACAADWYDFTSRYRTGGSRHLCPAPLPAAVYGRVQELAEAAHRALGARDLSRVDFVVEADGNVVLLEVNTLPGMTATSNYPEAAAAAGIPFGELCLQLVNGAMQRPLRSQPLAVAFPQ